MTEAMWVMLLALTVISSALVLGMWVAARCVQRQQELFSEGMRQVETGLQHERVLTARFADAMVAMVDATALTALLNGRSIPDRQSVIDAVENGLDPKQALKNARDAIQVQELRKLRGTLERIQGARPVMSGPGMQEGDGEELEG